jgi:hypothetical protein
MATISMRFSRALKSCGVRVKIETVRVKQSSEKA